MVLGDLIQRVQSLYSKGVESDDSRLTSRHIYHRLKTTRAKLFSQKAKKKQRISQWNYQTLSCVELIKVTGHDCPCIPPVGCSVLRSKYKLPQIISDLNGELIQSVTTIERGKKLDRVSLNAVNSLKGNKYTSKKLNFFIQDGYLYVISPTFRLGVLSVVALFEDPVEADKFKSLCDENCTNCTDCENFLDKDFPIDTDLVDTLIQMSVEELIVFFSQNREDLTNNSIDSLKQESK